MKDPVEALVHDHGHLSALLLDVSATAERVREGELGWDEAIPEMEHAAGLLRDALLEHFAKEEEALFPFVEEKIPRFAERCGVVRADHDVVCGKLDALLRACRTRDHAAVVTTLAEFERAYAVHSQKELELLREVATALDAEGRKALRELMEGL